MSSIFEIDYTVEDECWIPDRGHARLQLESGRWIHSYRYVYAHVHNDGYVPDDNVHHTCGRGWRNGDCVNPEHLQLLTSSKHTRLHMHGENHPNSKFTQEQADEIRRLYETTDHSVRSLGRMFNVSHTTISEITRGSSY